jgi:Cu+-exporting ATPase
MWQVTLAVGLGLMVLMHVPLYPETMDWLMPGILVVATVVQTVPAICTFPLRRRHR